MYFRPYNPSVLPSDIYLRAGCHSFNVLFFLLIRPLVSPIPNTWIFMRCIKWCTLNSGPLNQHSGLTRAAVVSNILFLTHDSPGSTNWSSLHSKAVAFIKFPRGRLPLLITLIWQLTECLDSWVPVRSRWLLPSFSLNCTVELVYLLQHHLFLFPLPRPCVIPWATANRLPAPELEDLISFSYLLHLSLVSLNTLIWIVITKTTTTNRLPFLYSFSTLLSIFLSFNHFFHDPQLSCKEKWAIKTSVNTQHASWLLWDSTFVTALAPFFWVYFYRVT